MQRSRVWSMIVILIANSSKPVQLSELRTDRACSKPPVSYLVYIETHGFFSFYDKTFPSWLFFLWLKSLQSNSVHGSSIVEWISTIKSGTVHHSWSPCDPERFCRGTTRVSVEFPSRYAIIFLHIIFYNSWRFMRLTGGVDNILCARQPRQWIVCRGRFNVEHVYNNNCTWNT